MTEQLDKNLALKDPYVFLKSYTKGCRGGFCFQDGDLYLYCLSYIQINFKKLATLILQKKCDTAYFYHVARRLSEVAFVLKYGFFPTDEFLKTFIKINYNLDHVQKNNDFFNFISKFYLFLEKELESFGRQFVRKEKYVKISKINLELYKNARSKFLNSVIKLSDLLTKEIGSFADDILLQGSYGDMAIVEGWSDLDVIVLLKREVFIDENIFYKAQKKFKKTSLLCLIFDPLSHHRFDILSPFDLDCYSDSFLPTEAFKDAVSLLGVNDDICFKVRNNKFDRSWKIYNFLSYFKHRAVSNLKSNRFLYKNDLSMVMLIPALLLQAQNINISKKRSLSSYMLEDNEGGAVNFATNERAKWHVGGGNIIFLLNIFNAIPYILLNIIIKLYKLIPNCGSNKELSKANSSLAIMAVSLLESAIKSNKYGKNILE